MESDDAEAGRTGSGRRRTGWSWRRGGPAPPVTEGGSANSEGPQPCPPAGTGGGVAAGGTEGLREQEEDDDAGWK